MNKFKVEFTERFLSIRGMRLQNTLPREVMEIKNPNETYSEEWSVYERLFNMVVWESMTQEVPFRVLINYI